MEYTEIRYRRRPILLRIVLLAFFFLLAVAIVISLKDDEGRLIFGTSALVSLLINFFMVRSLIKNKPVLTLSKESIIIQRGEQCTSLLWEDIERWHVGYDDNLLNEAGMLIKKAQSSEKYSLFIHTSVGSEVVNLDDMEKDVYRIYELMRYYEPKKW